MIDYEKLKIAHSLCDKMGKDVSLALVYPELYMDLTIFSLKRSYKFESLDLLIGELSELTQPEPKYESGQLVYTYMHGYIRESNVTECYWDSELNDYRLMLINQENGVTKISVSQSLVYPSKQALIDVQLEYWSGLKLEEQDKEINYCKDAASLYAAGVNKIYADAECQHESEEIGYTSNPPQNRCKKCGEFYR